MVFKSVLSATCAFIILVSFQTNAAIISGSHVLPNGKPVNLGGVEWLSIDATPTGAYNDVASMLEPGGALYGWSFATRTQTENLLDSLWGGLVNGWSESNFLGAEWFMNNFGWSSIGGVTDGKGHTGTIYRSSFWFAEPGDCGVAAKACAGLVNLEIFPYYYDPGRGYFSDMWGLSDGGTGVNTNNVDPLNLSNTAALLVRSTVVPLPAAIWLFGAGLIGLFGIAGRTGS